MRRLAVTWICAGLLIGSQLQVAGAVGGGSLVADLSRLAATRTDTFSVGVFDELHGRYYWFRSTPAYDNASIVKVNVLETLLWRAQRAHRPLTRHEQELSRRMVRNSDNDATTALWNQIGGASAVAAYDRILGLRHTTFDPSGHWGLTRSTVQDQLGLLRAAGSGPGPLSTSSRSYVRVQMANVEPDQRWGVSAGVPAGSNVELKNGWLPRATHGWRINSIGHVRNKTHDADIAFLSTDHASFAYGVDTAAAVSRIVYRDL
ncbi:MAG: hypothetical protein JWO12_2857 [Frankiales bacterium]|nr:hypothetical protein [Frankiales bacterium]